MSTAVITPEIADTSVCAAESSHSQVRWNLIAGRLAGNNWLIAIVAMVALSLASLGERVMRANGIGWDGTAYAGLVKDFNGKAYEGLDSYRVLRILPSLILAHSLQVLRIEPTDQVVIASFLVFNILLVGLTALVWCWVADLMSIGVGGKWLGIIGLVVNFSILKHAPYYPVLTDVGGAALSMAMVYCYLANRQLMMFALTVMGMLTWPTLLIQGACFLVFPRRREPILDKPTPWGLNYLLAAAITAAVTIVVFRYAVRPQSMWFFVPKMETLNLSVAILAAFLFFSLAPLLSCAETWNVWKYCTFSFVLRVTIVGAALFAVVLFRRLLATEPTVMDTKTYVKMVSLIAVMRPANFLLAHVVYFGPIVLLAMFFWKAACRQAHLLGHGFVVALMGGIIHSIDGESRHMVAVLPMLVPIVVKATEGRGWRQPQYLCLGILALLMSKCWLTINQGPFTGNVYSYPDQYYFMSHGHSMNDQMYLLQGGVVVLSAMLIYGFCVAPFRDRSPTVEAGNALVAT